MTRIEHTHGDAAVIEQIRPLWEQLNRHHERGSVHFAGFYRRFTFDERMQPLRDGAPGTVRVDLARDADAARPVGYCVSHLHADGSGEIDSLFVEDAYRGNDIASTLMQSGLDWLKANGAAKILIEVAPGNEGVFRFYERFGFYPRRTILAQEQP